MLFNANFTENQNECLEGTEVHAVASCAETIIFN